MSTDFFTEYHEYQKAKSLTGKIYQRFYLYPRINFYLPKKAKLLDVGCGLGDFLFYYSNKAQSVGLDINPHNIAFAKTRGLDVRQIYPQESFPVESNSFDVAILDNVLEHLEDPALLLTEIKRCLNDNGLLVIGVPGEKGHACDPDHKTYYDKDILINTLEKYGLSYKDGFYAPLPFLGLSKIMRQFCFYGFFGKNKSKNPIS